MPAAGHEQGEFHEPRRMAAQLGLEPRQNESESFVLPLHHRAVENFATLVSADRLTVVAARKSLARVARCMRILARRLSLRLSRGANTGAGDGIRTRNRLFTKQVLYR